MASLFDLLGGDKETSKSIVGSLFGLTPELVAQQQAQSNLQASQNTAMQYAQMDPMQRAQYAMFQGASGASSGLMGAIGPESAQVQRAKQEMALRQAMADKGISLDNPKGFAEASKLAMEMNLPDIAAKMGMAGAQLDKELSIAESKRQEKLTTAARQLQEAGYVQGSPEFIAKMREIVQADITGKSKGSGSSTSVTIDAGSLAKAMGVDVGKQAAGIEGKYSARDSIADAKKMLKDGIYAGAYGPEQMAAAKYTLGAAGSKQRVENTEQFMSHIGNVVIPRLQEFGGNDSVEELKYLQRVMGGEQRLEPKSLGRILDSADKKINRSIERIQAQTQAAGKKTPPPLGPGASREAETTSKPVKWFNPATNRIEVKQ